MELAWISLAALFLTVAVSCVTRLNPGILAVVLAWVVGSGIAPWFGTSIGVSKLLAGFPADLFLTLVGVTLLFTQAQQNGTLARVVRMAVAACGTRPALLPLVFFALSAGVSAVGAGSIAAAALVAPLAMAAARQAAISVFLMTIAVAHGGVAGTMSPFASTGVVAYGVLDRIALGGMEWSLFLRNLAANLLVVLAMYTVLLLRSRWREPALQNDSLSDGDDQTLALAGEERFSRRHFATLAAIAALLVAVVGFGLHVGMVALTAAVVLALFGLADETAALKALPWNAMLMVCGITVLVGLLQQTDGIALLTSWMVRISTRDTIEGFVAFVTGVISVYSSTSGVVLPTFLPGVPELVEQLGGGDPARIAGAIVVGSNLVDVSPISTVGAICIAAAPPQVERRRLFNRLFLWGLSMSVVAAAICQWLP